MVYRYDRDNRYSQKNSKNMASPFTDHCKDVDGLFFEGRSSLNIDYRYYPSTGEAFVVRYDPWLVPDLQEKGYNITSLTGEIFPKVKEEQCCDYVECNKENSRDHDHFHLLSFETLDAISHVDIIECNCNTRIISPKKVEIGETQYIFPDPVLTVPKKKTVKITIDRKKPSPIVTRQETMRKRIREIFESGKFTLDGYHHSSLCIRHFKEYLAEYRLRFGSVVVGEFKEILIEVLIQCGHDILANKEGDYKCRRPSLYFGLYVSK